MDLLVDRFHMVEPLTNKGFPLVSIAHPSFPPHCKAGTFFPTMGIPNPVSLEAITMMEYFIDQVNTRYPPINVHIPMAVVPYQKDLSSA